MKKYQNRYRIQSARLRTWDYGKEATYFITICTKNRKHYFGQIPRSARKMYPNLLGRIVIVEWLKSISLRPNTNLTLGEFVVMPNHFHAIIAIGENEFNRKDRDASNASLSTNTSNASLPTNTSNAPSNSKECPANQFGPQSQNLASIVGGFKSAITSKARQIGYVDFAWQPLYYDVIIRNKGSYKRIENYIKNNPAKWHKDKFNR